MFMTVLILSVVICIRIEPDWNVNLKSLCSFLFSPLIRIEPDWNVNILEKFYLLILKKY